MERGLCLTTSLIWKALEEVKDPEIPVVSLVEMGIVREVAVDDQVVVIMITPTFAGCPALQVMINDVEARIRQLGAEDVKVEVVLAPPWSSDWITPEARGKLKSFGLAPPPFHGGRVEMTFFEVAVCPYCDSKNTVVKNDFGPTLCRSIHYCQQCRQPFEQFKAL
jgi:ring-1,2-phenylacetyl-CoA epoxidase subunit PaaD